MKLKNSNVTIDKIMLDPFNPRFSIPNSQQQQLIQRRLMYDPKTKDLLYSMQTGLTWVNKIVVRRLSTFTDKEKEKLGDNIDLYDYVAVEGNTRLACLKDEKMIKYFDKVNEIPIIEAEKELKETQEEYERQIRRLQGIANVMAVKDWDVIPKAKHVYRLYEDKRNLYSDKTNQQIFKEISMEIGVKPGKIKTFVYRYIYYKELMENVGNVSEDDWKFFEIFEQNEGIRKIFGWNSEKSDFEWNNDSYEDEEILLKQELLYLFPEIIKSAKREEVSSKDIRDIIRKEYDKKEVEELIVDFKEVIKCDNDDYAYNKWKTKYLSKQSEIDNEIEWNSKLVNISAQLKQYPINEDWPINQKDKLLEIQKKVSQLIKYLETMG